MLFEGLALGFLVGWIRKGRLKNITEYSIRYLPLVVSAFLIQSLLNYDYSRSGYLTPYIFYLHIFSYLLLFIFIWKNRNLPGMQIMGVGILLNFVVIAANGGVMPVSPEGLTPELKTLLLAGGDALHSIITPETRLVFLSDIIPTIMLPGGNMSIGDILLGAGLFYFIQSAMVPSEPVS